MGAEALEAAVFNWAQKRGVDLRELGVDTADPRGGRGPDRLQVLLLTEPYLRRKIKELDLKTIPEITNADQGRRGLHVLPPRARRAAGPAGRDLGPRKATRIVKQPDVLPDRAADRPSTTPGAAAVALPVRQEGREGRRRVRPADAGAETAATWRSSTSRTTWSTPSSSGACAGLRRRAADPEDDGRADAQGAGRRADPGHRGVSGRCHETSSTPTTTPPRRVAPEVVEAMVPFLTEDYFNPARCTSRPGRRPRRSQSARETVAALLGAGDPQQILFTSCATESNNTAIFGAVKANPQRRHIITTAVEHPAVLEVCKDLERDGLRGDLPAGRPRRATSTCASSSAPCGPTRCWSRSCTPTTRPA